MLCFSFFSERAVLRLSPRLLYLNIRFSAFRNPRISKMHDPGCINIRPDQLASCRPPGRNQRTKLWTSYGQAMEVSFSLKTLLVCFDVGSKTSATMTNHDQPPLSKSLQGRLHWMTNHTTYSAVTSPTLMGASSRLPCTVPRHGCSPRTCSPRTAPMGWTSPSRPISGYGTNPAFRSLGAWLCIS